MVDVFDLEPLTATVKVRGKTHTIYPVSFSDLISLVNDFPAIRGLMRATQEKDAKSPVLSAASFISQVPEAVGSLIAICLGRKGDKKVEKWGATLPMTSQLRVINTILEITFAEEEDGFGPFVQEFVRLSKNLKVGTQGLPTNSAEPSGEQFITDFPVMQRGVAVRVN